MKLYCNNYFSKEHEKINLSKDISCCLGLLLEKYDESELYSSQKSYAGFLVRTFNHYLKLIDYNITNENNFFEKESEINYSFLSKLINIISHYSIILIQHNKYDFTKLICSVGIDLINFSKYKYEKNIIRKKAFLLSTLSCEYLAEKRYYKSKIFLDKCIEINKNSLDYIITYNNYCMVFIKKIKNKEEINDIKKIIDNIIYYLHLELKEIKKRIINKYRNDLKFNQEINNEIADNKKNKKENYYTKKETTCFLLYNCFYIMKFFDRNEFDKNYNNALKIIQKLLGVDNLITIKMMRINYDNNNNNNNLIENMMKKMENEKENSKESSLDYLYEN